MHVFDQGDSHMPHNELVSSANLFEETSTNLTNHDDYRNTEDTSSQILPDFELIDKDIDRPSEQNNTGRGGEIRLSEQVNLKDAASEFALNNFEEMDTDGDGYLSDGELEIYGEQSSLTSEEQELMTVLKNNNEEWQKRSDDEWFFENNGVSKSDLAKPLIGKEIERIVENKFDAIDTDNDGLMEKDEIENYQKETKPGYKEQEALEWLSGLAEIASPSFLSGMNPFGARGLNKEQAKTAGESATSIWNNN